MMDFRVISIGTLPSHPLWNERGETRTGHATTTVIKSDERVLLVDPSLPAPVINARLQERWGMGIDCVTHVFLTSFDPDRRRTLDELSHTTWYMNEPEIQGAQAAMQEELQRAQGDQDLEQFIEHQLGLLLQFVAPEDQVMQGVDLFPLPGYTIGTCGLLLPTAKRTIVIAGDAAPTVEHIECCQVLSNCEQLELAMESLQECIEIADIIVPGRDNVVLNPIRS